MLMGYFVVLSVLVVVSRAQEQTPDACQGLDCRRQWSAALGLLEEKFNQVIEGLQFELHHIQEINDELVVKVANLEAARHNGTNAGPKSGFRVSMSGDVTVSHPNIVKFNRVQMNNGGGYDTGTGKFTCPVSGLYSFSVHLMSNTRYLEFKLKANDRNLALFLLQPSDDIYYIDGSTITVQCTKGEQVYLVVHWGPGQSTVLHGPWNYFSGHLVRAD